MKMGEEALVGFWLPYDYDVTIITPEGRFQLNGKNDDYLTVGVKTHHISGWKREKLIQAYSPCEEMRINYNSVFVFYPKKGL